jgi:hypothetical protein
MSNADLNTKYNNFLSEAVEFSDHNINLEFTLNPRSAKQLLQIKSQKEFRDNHSI